jgi:beta-lactamase superfamily II metal-dependent hydrolase
MDFYELDFFEVGNGNSGDAISLRYGQQNTGIENIHVVDGGYADDGQRVLDHIGSHYDQKNYIDHVVLTHPDTDHASGLKTIVRDGNVAALWMNRPWAHVDTLLPLFEYNYTRDGLIQRLKKNYPHAAELEEIANERGIHIYDAFQGDQIGAFTVLAPTQARYLSHIVNSDKTPESGLAAAITNVGATVTSAIRSIAALWGHENLKGDIDGTSDENETSVVQYANLGGHKILLTGDAGIKALDEAYEYALRSGLIPGVTYFQVPHHGSRHNLSSALMDRWFGPVLPSIPATPTFTAIISASGSDEDHPRKAVVRSVVHRGGRVATTKKASIRSFFLNKPMRPDWIIGSFENYPEETEE